MAVADNTDPAALSADARLSGRKNASILSLLLGNRGVFWGSLLLGLMVLIAIIGPIFTLDPTALSPMTRLKPPSATAFFGSDLWFLGSVLASSSHYHCQVSAFGEPDRGTAH